MALVVTGKAEAISRDVIEQYRRSHYAGSTVLDRLPAAVLHVTT